MHPVHSGVGTKRVKTERGRLPLYDRLQWFMFLSIGTCFGSFPQNDGQTCSWQTLSGQCDHGVAVKESPDGCLGPVWPQGGSSVAPLCGACVVVAWSKVVEDLNPADLWILFIMSTDY